MWQFMGLSTVAIINTDGAMYMCMFLANTVNTHN